MKCLHCAGEEFVDKACRFTPKIKRRKVEVIARAMVCKNCQNALMNDEQMNYLMKVAISAYKKKAKI